MADGGRIGFGPRFGAYILDIIIGMIGGFLIGSVAGATLGALFTPEGSDAAMGGMLGGIMGSIAGLYAMQIIFFIMEGMMGQSPGKMILKLKVKNQSGSAAGSGDMWVRSLLKYIGPITALITGITMIGIVGTVGGIAGFAIFIGCFFTLGKNKLAFHDMIAKTAIYKN
jgi:uncharacterized RDD family membrane protein YckC